MAQTELIPKRLDGKIAVITGGNMAPSQTSGLSVDVALQNKMIKINIIFQSTL
jgi:hypothetical protein